MTDLIHATDPKTGKPIDPGIALSDEADIDRLCAEATAAFRIYRNTSLETRAAFLEAVAAEIMESGEALIERVMVETGLPRTRVEGERARTCGQLRLFARVVRDGDFLDARIDPARPDRQPLPRVDLRLRNIGTGPVAVFGASNFPLAFSVAGGDTASALAAGCPVIVKAHPAHPGTSEIVATAIRAAITRCDLPAGVFGMVVETGIELGAALVTDPRIKAVAFTGSRQGGLALMQAAAGRPEPIPVYAEMSSINPVLLFPAALASRGSAIGQAFATSLQIGAGQFCTNPGLVLGTDGPGLDAFIAGATASIEGAMPQTMLTPGIHAAYDRGVSRLASHAGVRTLARGDAPSGPHDAQAALFETDLAGFLEDGHLQDEVFGPSSLLVRVPDAGAFSDVLAHLEGQLTIALHMDEPDHPVVTTLLPVLEEKAGRILVNGFGTGVEVADAMVHGGPFPATSDSRTTSVGTLAIRRFLRPVCYQDLPQALLARALRDGNPLGINRMIDGKIAKH
ncbi:aldehyde dehydrogenase (NADP(+)) [Acetobacter oeni]|uniref:2,5-dioxovalerate dehydrogenase n=1 Tax=Acetobacter oeni TaxID=304077 RepID=A0A511XP04_9PROT|nr:aldehyde dehydrogenase (NADP(+)) [Acetobacter oeni]MBB3882613.1 NADP-dependent aldehyde dehydrogenase [Acetobacter oeni]NHO18717.1 aldehyde dehydrogenase family protein [Acetobacter oeni]GBR09012.1 NAD-dependent aldehyde dehydrogenase [Acetobacter oeni LMG 21952]GEN64634.1 fatty aldehyde dehydrogenase [Acetobacter oeni]